MNDLVRSGKVRYLGCCNFAAWQISEALWTSKTQGLEHFVAAQSRYNFLDRGIERELLPCCLAHGVAVVPWGPLASGFLTGKYLDAQAIPTGSRLANPASSYADVATEANFEKLRKLETFARQRGIEVGQLAIAWLLAHPWLGSVIAGATSIEQVSYNCASADVKLSAEDLGELDKMI